MLFGLPIDGKDVNGRVNQDNAICEELLGVSLFEQGSRGQGINLRLLREYHSSLVITENSTEQEKMSLLTIGDQHRGALNNIETFVSLVSSIPIICQQI